MTQEAIVAASCKDPGELINLAAEDLFDIPQAVIDEIQLSGLQRRFAELADKLPSLKALAEEAGVSAIERINDVVPLLYPHTEYKSYPLSFIDNCRFEQLNEWLGDFTTHDLSELDLSACKTLDDWLEIVERETPVRVITSSGTSGKISLLPRSTTEEPWFAREYFLGYAAYRNEGGIDDPYGPSAYHVQVNPRHGRMAGCRSTWVRINEGFGGDESHVVTMDGHLSTDVLWMTGRMRKAQADGMMESLKKTKAWERLSEKFGALEAARAKPDDAFYTKVLTGLSGKTVAMAAGLTFYWDMLECARRNGLEIDFAPDSMFMTAGGLKGVGNLTGEQIETITSTFPLEFGEFYGCSELMALARKCPEGHFHMPPSIVNFVLDPDTSEPLPREGMQTGRYAAFDLWAQTYWGGIITGDEVTINFNGGCGCGRTGAYMLNDIGRYSDRRGGDDKISCQRTAAAVEEMMQSMKEAIG